MSRMQYYQMLSTMCPMHVIMGRSAQITFAGPTARKLCPDALIERAFLDIFEIKRPREISTMEALIESAGKKLNLTLRAPPYRQLKGVLMEGPEVGQLIVNLSFGISVVEAVQDYNLTAADFAPTDLTVEMLYLVEAKSAAMKASRQLNERLQAARIDAEERALTDTLTGLQNRRGMDRMLAKMIEGGRPFAVMQLDLDYFKAVNDTLGHAAGDHVLQEVGRIMTEETRSTDVVARVGGDEFVILVNRSLSHDELAGIAERINARLEGPILYQNRQCRISGSIGIVLAVQYAKPSADELLGDVDTATYAAKHAGRGCHAFYSKKMRRETREGWAVRG